MLKSKSLSILGILGIFFSTVLQAQNNQFVDYFEENSIDVYELKGKEFVPAGKREKDEVLSTCPSKGLTNIRILAEQGRYYQLECGDNPIWVRTAILTTVVKVDVNCTKTAELPISKKQVVHTAGTRGAGAVANGCK